jgi:hypothetical protein
MRQYAGVMEWWSNGVMKGLIEIEFRALAFSNTPILHHSSTPKPLGIFPGKAIEI